jgi:CRP-like cAMP-binding protein
MRTITSDPARRRLRNVELFAECSRSQLSFIDRLGFTLSLPAGRELFAEGELGFEFWVLLEGVVALRSSDGATAVLSTGASFGGEGLVENAPHRATATTLSPVTLVVYNRREFNSLARRISAVKHHWFPGFTPFEIGVRSGRVPSGLCLPNR